MRQRTLLVAGSLLMCLILLAIVLATPTHAPSLPITAALLRYTNNSNGILVATFALTNRSGLNVIRWSFYCPEGKQYPGLRSTYFLDSRVFLAPGQSEIITVETPTNLGTWRVAFHCSPDGWRRRFSDWCKQGSGRVLNTIVPYRLQSVPFQRVESEWIDP